VNVLNVILLATIIFGLLWLYGQVYRPLRRVRELAGRIHDRRPTAGYMQKGKWGISDIIRSLRDIDEEMGRLNAQIDNEELGLQGVLMRMMEGVVILNEDGTVRMTNPPFCELFDYRDEPVGRRLYEICRNMEVRQAGDLALIEGKSGQREVIIREDPGQVQRLQVALVSYAPLRAGGSATEGAVLVFHDISRIKQLELLRKEFVANLSHEVRTPLAIFKGYLETMIDAEDLPEEDRRRSLQVLHRHSERMNLLVEDLLTLSRFESSGEQLTKKEADVKSFLTRVCEDCRQLLAEDHTELVLLAEDDLPAIALDQARMEQVFYNLVDNALRHSGETDRIEIGAVPASDGRQVEFYVRDYGVGIPSDKLNHIFERFYRGDRGRARATGGTGLGLSIVKHIIHLHGGRVWAESALGQGACVRFILPVEAEVDIDVEEAARETLPAPGTEA
jgi:two-component system phosphate regulon sensor histidine kinase PhoR